MLLKFNPVIFHHNIVNTFHYIQSSLKQNNKTNKKKIHVTMWSLIKLAAILE